MYITWHELSIDLIVSAWTICEDTSSDSDDDDFEDQIPTGDEEEDDLEYPIEEEEILIVNAKKNENKWSFLSPMILRNFIFRNLEK